MKTLRNKQKREQEFQNDPKENGPKKTVHPSVLCAIIEDLERHSTEQIKKNYNLDDEFLQILGNELKIAKTKIDLKGDSKVSMLFLTGTWTFVILTQRNRRKNLLKSLTWTGSMGFKALKTPILKINWNI